MEVLKDRGLLIVRGNTGRLVVSCERADGTLHPFEDGDTVYFTVKRSANNEQKQIEKRVTAFEGGAAVIEFTPADTASLQFGDYQYDVQLVDKEGNVITIITPQLFRVGEELTGTHD